jgi:hypothetical protein
MRVRFWRTRGSISKAGPSTVRYGGNTSVHYHDLVEGRFTIDNLQVTTHYLNHPALTLG